MRNILYLHGFASGLQSTKGRFFATRFQQIGAQVHQADMEEGDFRGLTLTRQLELIDRLARELQPELVIGSSLGGYLAALYGALQPQVAPALVLLAPAFAFARRWAERLGAEKMAEWREKGEIDVYHYGEGAARSIGYQLYHDALWFDEFPAVTQPTLVYHGKRDEVVDPALSVEFAIGKPNVQVELLDSEHGLTDRLDEMWAGTAKFYQRPETVPGLRA